MRTIDLEHNWFWKQGYRDGFKGLRPIVPDEARHSFQRSDYFSGCRDGEEERSIILGDAEEEKRALQEYMNMLVGPWDDINCPYDPTEHRYH